MKISFLVGNQCWIILFGDTIIDLDGKKFWNDLDELKWELRLKGLKIVSGSRVVSAGHRFTDSDN